ncbi:HEAT repeat domain-containing protein [Candidatus Uabimicrobium sp. HlEnr_7]|uniref:HEAT repeat domain-containing protein n=1 Tax=Candidatus Uabimicrobium helgolandensis TaxID=3095367 RepID=UPI0035589B91
MVPKYEELYKLVVREIGLQRLQNRLYPFKVEDDDIFRDHSQHGFLGKDEKLLPLVAQDWQVVLDSGTSHQEIAQALRNLMDGNGQLHPDYEYQHVEYMTSGWQSCPWGCSFAKGNDHGVIYCKKNNESILINTLHSHLIEEHFFFQGKDVYYRLDPNEITNILLLGEKSQKVTEHLCKSLQCEDLMIVHYALSLLQGMSSAHTKRLVAPHLKKLLRHDNEDLLQETLKTIKKLSIRELAENIAELLIHPNRYIQIEAKSTLEDMDFLVRPIFCDLQQQDLGDIVLQLQEKLENNEDIENVIDSLGRIGKEVPQLFNFFGNYSQKTILAVLRIVKKSPQFISYLQPYHWNILEASIEEKRLIAIRAKDEFEQLIREEKGEEEKLSQLLKISRFEDEEDLLFYFAVSCLRFNHSVSVNTLKQICPLSIIIYRLGKEPLKYLYEYLPQILLENKNKYVENFVSRLIKDLSFKSIEIRSSERFIKQLLKFVEHPFTVPKLEEVGLLPWERKSKNTWVNIIEVLGDSSIKKEQIAGVCMQNINHDNRDIRLQVIENLGKLKHSQAVGTLIEFIDSEDKDIQKTTIRTLENIGIGAEDAVSHLMLQDEELIIDALFSIGSSQSVPMLLEYLEKINYKNSKYIYLLSLIKDDRIVPTLLKGIIAKAEISRDVVSTLFRILNKQQLSKFWQTCDQKQQVQLIKILGRESSYPYKAELGVYEILLSNWQQHIKSHDDDLRLATISCICWFITEKNATVFLYHLFVALRDDATMMEAAKAIGTVSQCLTSETMTKVGLCQIDIIRFLVDAMTDEPSLFINYVYRKILLKINGDNEYGLDKFLLLLDEEIDAAILLLEPLGDVAVDALYQQTKNQKIERAQAATYALYKINSPRCVTYLVKLISHPNAIVRMRAALRLCEYKEHCSQAIKVFIDILQGHIGENKETALERLLFFSNKALENLEEHIVELIFEIVNLLAYSSAQSALLKFGSHPIVCRMVSQQEKRYSQHPKNYILNLFKSC